MIPTMVVGDCYGSLLRQTIPETLKCSIKTGFNSFLTVTADCYGKRSFSAFSDNADSSVPNDPNADDMISVQSRASRLFGKVAKGSDTKLDQGHFPNAAKRIGLISRGGNFYVRLHIPRALHRTIGRKEIVRSLRTGKLQDAIRRARIVGADFESWLNQSASQMSMGAPVSEPSLASAPAQSAAPAPQIQHVAASIGQTHPDMSLRSLYDIFIKDPSKYRSEKAIWGYQNALELAEDVLGKGITIGAIDRQCGRKVLEVARGIPLNFKKRFPKLNFKHAASKAKAEKLKLISPKTINDYLIKLSTMMNFAVDEGYVGRNPFRGLRVVDTVHPRDKRYPFSDQQLWQLFNAPLYRGCVNDEEGYDQFGTAHPRRGRFWIPLIALFGGLRLNEACQLDITDIKTVEGILCFSVSPESITGDKDKRLKTKSSFRIVPVHRQLLEMGFAEYVEEQRQKGSSKLFPELPVGSAGYYSDPFSKWFVRFQKKCGAAKPKTSFHSFRHCFRDALRRCRLDHEVGLSLGGWTSSGRDSEAASNYGNGYSAVALKEAIDKVAYPELDLTHLVRRS